jgi:hypothetical protein
VGATPIMKRHAHPGAAFYCVADARYFLGAVAMVNSLRLHDHAEPVFMLDCGLTQAQREMLESHVTLVRAPNDTPPYLLKTVAPMTRPAETMVLIDADMIVTRPLTELIASASTGRIVTFENDRDRFVPQWGELLDLGTARRQPYVSVGLVFLGGSVGQEVVGLMDDRQRRVDFDLTWYGTKVSDYPFLYPEQDVLNAILCTRVQPARVVALDHDLAPTPPFRGVRLVNEDALQCAYRDGTRPYVLHHFHRKPWLDRMRHGIYSRLLARLLLSEDVAVRVPAGEVPLRMREGLVARAERTRVDAQDVFRRYLRDPIVKRTWKRAQAARRRGPERGQ